MVDARLIDIVGNPAYLPCHHPARCERPSVAEYPGTLVRHASVGGIVKGDGQREVWVFVGVKWNGHTHGPSVQRWGKLSVLYGLPSVC